jgi:hypothetical protein
MVTFKHQNSPFFKQILMEDGLTKIVAFHNPNISLKNTSIGRLIFIEPVNK